MRRFAAKLIIVGIVAIMGVLSVHSGAYAEGEEGKTEADKSNVTTSLTISPVSKTWSIKPNNVYDGKLTVTNDGSEEMKVSVYASPYFYSYSEQEDTYKLGFNVENSYTQIARWITIKDSNGNYVANPTFTIPSKGEGESVKTFDIEYRITTPASIPDGGQYAALFVQTLTGRTNQNGIHTETSAGMIIIGHSAEGETVVKSEINNMSVGFGERAIGTTAKNVIYGNAKIKNTGNTDFYAKGVLKVEPIIGFSSYETEDAVTVSVIPDAELPIEEKWTETPGFGIYKVTWTITAGEANETVEQVIFIVSPIFIIISIIVLTIVVISIIIGVRRSKERKSRLAV